MFTRWLWCCLLLCTFAFGQGTTSRVVGTVSDSTGAVVPNASVKLTNENTGVSYSTTSTDAGNYVFEAIQIGLYRVEVEAPGFKKYVSPGNQLTIGQAMTVNAVLQVGAQTEKVEVVAAAEIVQTSQSSNLGPLVNQKTITDMPIVATRRRDPTAILQVVPGMNNGANTGGGGHMNGARDRAWNFTLDGIDMNETSAGGGIGNNPIRVNPESVSEMRIISSNPSAEFGRNSGATVTLVTRSGTNELHGNAFWFYRTPRLNANQWENNIDGIGKQNFVQHIFGGSVGGPIIKNKLFYFANWQELRAARSVTQTATVLTASARQGIFRYATSGRNTPFGAPGASVDANGNPVVATANYNILANDPLRKGVDKAIQELVTLTPTPNNFTGGDGLNTGLYIFRPTETEEQRDLTGKVDYVWNDKNALYFRVYGGFQNTLCDGVNGGLPAVPGAPCLTDTKRSPLNMAFNWRNNLAPNKTNEFVVGWSKFFFDFPNPEQDLTKVTVSAPYTIPLGYYYNNARELRTLQFVDNFSWIKGKHAIKFGTNIRLVQHLDTRGSIGGQNSSPIAALTTGTNNAVDPNAFNLPSGIQQANDRPALENMINFLLGRVNTVAQGFVAKGNQFTTGTFDFDSRFYEFDFYVQDTWKVSKNLTIDYGLRLDARLAPRSGGGTPLYVPNFVPVAGAAPSNTLKWQSADKLWNDDWNNFGPSVGFAWDPFGTGKTSIRGNYRLAYDRMPTFTISSAVLPNMPGSTLGVVDNAQGQAGVRLSDLKPITPTRAPADLQQPIPFSNNNNTVVDPRLETPQTNMWSFGIQREIFNRTVLEVNYIGRRAHNLLGAYNVNQAEIRRNGFIDAFKVVQAGGDSPLMNQIFLADSRRGANETGSQLVRRLFPSQLSLNSVAAVASSAATRAQGTTNLTDASGLGPYFFYRYPQFSGGLTVVDSNDFSTYNGLQVMLDRRFRSGATVQVNYTLSKSLDTRSFDPVFTLAASGNSQSAGSSPFDIENRRLNYALSDFDRTHNLGANFVLELPFGRGKRFGGNANAFWNRIIGGWQMAGLLNYSSGRPFSVFGGTNSFSNQVQSFANCNGCSRTDGEVHEEGGIVWYLYPNERAKFSVPGVGELGNTGRNFLRGPSFYNLDASFSKRTVLTERLSLELRADFSNLTNTPSFGAPTATVTSTIFGRIRNTVVSSSRQTMLGAKLTF
jgi:hypothetical protein